MINLTIEMIVNRAKKKRIHVAAPIVFKALLSFNVNIRWMGKK